MEEQEEQPGRKERDEVAKWLDEIAQAKKRERDFRKDGERIREIYAGEKKDTTPFNILFSNTETILPALYSATPKPDVRRRFHDDDPAGLLAARAGKRALEFMLDTNIEGYDTFDAAMRAATLDMLLVGRGVVAVKYDADLAQADGAEYVKNELVCPEIVAWNRVFFGYAKKWSKVPWIAYEQHLDRKECERLFGESVAARIKYEPGESSEPEPSHSVSVEKNTGDIKTALVYQIWDKHGGRKIRWVSPCYPDGYLRVDDDPYGLTGFFNMPRPMQFVEKTADLVPVAPYALYENQATELNRLTVRINRIIEAIKARGAYDGQLGPELERIMQADDNTLIPADSASVLATEKGFDNAIWFLPIERLIQVLRELYVAREACKQVIYEIIGIADILRGVSRASETLGAQQIKERWGSLRIRSKQKEVARFARDCLRIMLEMAASRMSEETFARMTGMNIPTSARREQARAIVFAATQAGQPPPAQEAAIAQGPSWAEIKELLANDLERSFRIDIETNSTVEPDAFEDKRDITEMMGALSAFLNGTAPLVERGVLPFEAAQAMLVSIARRFQFGNDIEEHLLSMRPPQQRQDQAQVALVAEVERLKTALKAAEEEKAFVQRQAALQVAEAEVKMRQALLEEKERDIKERLALREKEIVRSLEGDRKVAEVAKQSAEERRRVSAEMDARLASGIAALQGIVARMAELQNEMISRMSASNEEMRAAVTTMAEAILRAATAPRVFERDPRTGRVVRSRVEGLQ